MTEKPRVLLIDDGDLFARLLGERMPEIELIAIDDDGGLPCVPDGPSALAFLEQHADKVDLILLDVQFDIEDHRLLPLGPHFTNRQTRRFQGVAILRELRLRYSHLPVVLLTSVEDLSLVDLASEVAGESMTYFFGTEDLDALRIHINSALAEARLELEEEGILWGADPHMRSLRRRLAVVSRGPLPVVLEGETGTGKSFLAERFIHRNSGRTGQFVAVDLSTIPDDLVSSTLFGSVRGAYTGSVEDRRGVFQLAHRGTLFLDEIQNVSPENQRQLLHVLQERRVRPLGANREIEVDVKVVVASNTPLVDAVRAGRFRRDLYMRLSPATRTVLPPLRERPDDIQFLIKRFVKRSLEHPEIEVLHAELVETLGLQPNTELGLTIGHRSRSSGDHIELIIAKPTWKRLLTHTWPGNLRELSMVIHNIVSFTLVGAVDAVHSGLNLESVRFQVDPVLVTELLASSKGLGTENSPIDEDFDQCLVQLEADGSLNAVAKNVERQYFLSLFQKTEGDFEAMANLLLGDTGRSRAIRLRFNQLGLKVRELRS